MQAKFLHHHLDLLRDHLQFRDRFQITCQCTLWTKATPLCRLNPECWHHRQAQDLRLLRRHLLQPYQMLKCQTDCFLLLNGTTASITQDLQDESVDQRDLEKLFVSKRTHCVFPMMRKTIISQAWI